MEELDLIENKYKINAEIIKSATKKEFLVSHPA